MSSGAGSDLRNGPHPFSRFASSMAGLALAAIPAIAVAQEAQTPTADSAPDQLRKISNPPEGDVLAPKSLFQLFFGVKTAPGSGANGSIRTVTTDTFKLRADTRVDLTPDWQLALRGDLPFLAKNPLNSSNPNADTLYGVGDADVQAALIHEIDARWTAGFGARLIMPTGDDNLGSGKWQIMPIAGARYSMPDVGWGMYVEPLLRYDISFAGDPTRKIHQQSSVCAGGQLLLARGLVSRALSKSRHSLEFRSGCHWSDRASLSALRRPRRAQIHQDANRLARGRRSDHQSISSVRLQDGTQSRYEVLICRLTPADRSRPLVISRRLPIVRATALARRRLGSLPVVVRRCGPAQRLDRE